MTISPGLITLDDRQPQALSPADEARRLDSLRSFEILDTENTREFDEIAQMAAMICGTEGGQITLIDEDRQWIKSSVGIEGCPPSVDRSISFCAHTIPTRSTLVVEDSLKDLRFADNPFATSGAIRFYAGSPIIDSGGSVLGAVCVLDSHPRAITSAQIEALEILARQAMDQIMRHRLRQDISGALGQTEALRLLAMGMSLTDVLGMLTSGYEETDPDALCSIMLVEGGLLFTGAASSLDQEYADLIDGSPVGPNDGSCGSAVFYKENVITEDIMSDPRWDKYRPVASKFGLRSCWSVPVIGRGDQVVATFAVYHRRVAKPDMRTLDLLDNYARVASVAIESKRQHEAVAAARDAAETESRFKSEFLANMSHEIRTPLNGVVGMANELAMSELTEAQRDDVTTIQNSAQTLLMVINDILDISKIEAGAMRLDRSRGNLKRVITEAITTHRAAARKNNTELELHYVDGTPQHFIFDSLRIKQIVGNLVSNAVKFTVDGKVSVRVSRTLNEMVRIEVRDTGIGIADEHQQTIFQKFTQADATTTRRYGGTGLGLAIVKSLVTIKGGTLHLKSEVGVGSTFTVELPLKRGESASPDREDGNLPELFTGRVLLAEDNEVNRRVAENALRRLGVTVVTVDDGEKAVAMFREQKFDMILMDIQMPKMDGYEAARIIRNDGTTIPIVALTAHALSEQREKCLEAGMDGHLAKPFSLSELRHVLSQYLAPLKS